MLFMNEHEIEEARVRYRDHAVLGPAAETLGHLAHAANSNSDGWAYWPKPCRAAAKLQELIQAADKVYWSGREPQTTTAEYRRTLGPIKAFRTRSGISFEIVEVK